MDLEAESVDPGSNALLAFVGPGIMNARSISRGIGGFITPLPATGGKNQFIRAILENMAFAVRANIEQITEVAHKKPTKLKVCGGSSRSKTWLKVLANVTNLPVYAPRTIEASAAGAAVCASVGASVYSSFDDAVKNMVNLKDPIIPNTDISKQYNDPYKRWKKFYKKLSEVGRT
jgi:autoinducer 2 (AI-2) kinase